MRFTGAGPSPREVTDRSVLLLQPLFFEPPFSVAFPRAHPFRTACGALVV